MLTDIHQFVMIMKNIIMSRESLDKSYLGEGEFGQVFRAEIRKIGAVAVRKINLEVYGLIARLSFHYV